MTLNGVMDIILRYFTEFVYDVVVKSSRSLSHLLMSFLFLFTNYFLGRRILYDGSASATLVPVWVLHIA